MRDGGVGCCARKRGEDRRDAVELDGNALG
jgi:hypothetical protein